jgi:site-specific DNA-methyltransferase (adenine-specific)
MSDINHFAISSILNSEIVVRSPFGHGQIGSLGDAQRYFDLLGVTESPAVLHRNEEVDVEKVIEAFHAVRNARGDRGSPDLYVADPERNAVFLARCRELGLRCSDYLLNKTLMNARRNRLLRGLRSVKTPMPCEDYAFACEFAATELKYKTGASIDDIICDPALASRFDGIARGLAPGFTPFRYRWGILSIRKAGTNAKWRPDYQMPEFTGRFRLVTDPLDRLPEDRGVYLLYENGKEKPLYARSTEHLRHAIELHRSPRLMSAILDRFWRPNVENFLVAYELLPSRKLLKPVEKKVIDERKPVFNVPRRRSG